MTQSLSTWVLRAPSIAMALAAATAGHGGTGSPASVAICQSNDAPPPVPSGPIVTARFTPNATTVSTSEGAPYLNCDFWVAGPSKCQTKYFGYGPTRVIRLYVCLSGEVSTSECSQQPAVTGPLSPGMLADIGARLAAFAGTGARLLVRFTYNFGPSGPGAMDAPISLILQHLDQLAPILLAQRDLIFALEAGFIGTWGEWHDSTNGNDSAAAQKALLDRELGYFSGLFPILVRYPGDLIQYVGDTTPPANLGLHDDYYASSDDDGATWNSCDHGAGYCSPSSDGATLRPYAASVATTTMFAGEFGALDPFFQSCAALDAYSYTYHPQSISFHPFPGSIITELTNEGCALAFYNRVGTRIELLAAKITGDARAGATLHVELTMANTGYGRVIRDRPATVVLLSQQRAAVATVPVPLSDLDLRSLASSSSATPKTFAFDVPLPSNLSTSGSLSFALAFPDPAPSLAGQAAYSLPLNSLAADCSAVFDPATGYNLVATLAAPSSQ
jgi:Domain of unknown function (DUF4874)/Domain of unknown function (DUF4832)